MVVEMKKLSLAEMEKIAKEATFAALSDYSAPIGRSENLTLGKELTDSEGIFELYIAGDRPQDAKIISCATVDRITGKVQVEIFL